MQKTKVAVYGMTTEGYTLASRLLDRAAVTMVDETLQMAMELDAHIARTHPSLQDLVGGESLLGLKPVSQVISEANVVFFTPKLRKTGDESIIESNAKIREVARNFSKGATLVNMLPVGVGGNSDNIALVEKQTGLKMGETANYAYCPMRPKGELGTAASLSKLKDAIPLEELGLKSTYGNITQGEIEYVSSVIAESASIATEVELMRKARAAKAPTHNSSERFIDDLSSHVYDLTVIQASEDVGEPLTYLAGAAIKSLENHIRYIVDETREMLRDLQLKASRTKVIVAWTIDRYEMRADRSKTAESLLERLRDYVTDVRLAQRGASGHEVMDAYKHNIAIACSTVDYDWLKRVKGDSRSAELSLLRGTPSLQRN